MGFPWMLYVRAIPSFLSTRLRYRRGSENVFGQMGGRGLESADS